MRLSRQFLAFSSYSCYNVLVSFLFGFSFPLSERAAPDPRETETRQKKVVLRVNRFRFATMAKKLYIGNLSYGTNDESLRAAFETAGPVSSANVIMDKMTGRSRGFGFVEMTEDADAEKAISMWNGKELDGRALVVNEARPMEERPPRQDQGGSRW
jgi:hypothetical protein